MPLHRIRRRGIHKCDVRAGASETLKLADSFDFSGIVSGFNQNDHIDLRDISFGAGTTAGYVENQAGTGGTLSVTDGAHAVNIELLGHYSADDLTVPPPARCCRLGIIS